MAGDGTETLQYSYNYSYGNPIFEAYGYYSAYWSDNDGDGISETFTEYGYTSGLSVKNVTVGNAYSSLVEGAEADLEIVDLTAESAAGYGIYASWRHYTPQVEIEGISIGSTAYAGLYLDANTPTAGYALISDVELSSTGGDGVNLSGFSEWSVSDLTVADAVGYGFYADGSYAYYDYAANPATYVYGTLEPIGSLEEVLISSATYSGIAVSSGSLLLESSSVSGGDGTGVSLSSLDAWVEDNAFINNAAYGMTCSDVSFAYCGSNDLSGNTSGEHSDCSDDCVVF